jgi:hypothetical protein
MDTNEAWDNEEARMSNAEGMTKWQMSNPVAAATRNGRDRQIPTIQPFLSRVSSLIRHSSFGFRHFNEFVLIRG